MTTYRKISRLRRYVDIDPHALKQFLARIDGSLPPAEVEQRLINAYLRGSQLHISKIQRMKQSFKYWESAACYRYGDLVVVVRESGPRFEECKKTILTCYRYRNSKFDPGVFD